MTFNELNDLLPKLGLVTQGELLDAANSLPREKRDKVEEVLTLLVRQHKLTKFQAQSVFKGAGKLLVLGTYIIEDKLGTGGFGTVFRAKHKLMDRPVAIKVMHKDKLHDRDTVNRFLREVKAVARLEHPNIVKAYDADQFNGLYFLAMELVDGKPLNEVLKSKGKLPVEVAANLIRQAADGLDYAHRQGVIHRDIKPANLLLDSKGCLKILDMGLARLNAPKDANQNQMTEVGTSLGTGDFMAPEQAVDSLQADARSDIYSLGCTLYFLLCSDVMFPNRSEAKRIIDHHVTPPPSLRLTRADVPVELDQIFLKMVAKSPQDRYQSMEEVIADLDAMADLDDLDAGQLTGYSASSSNSSVKVSASTIKRPSPDSSLNGKSRSAIARKSGPQSSSRKAPKADFIPESGAWYEPILRPENRKVVIGAGSAITVLLIVGTVMLLPSGRANRVDTNQQVAVNSQPQAQANPEATTVMANKPRIDNPTSTVPANTNPATASNTSPATAVNNANPSVPAVAPVNQKNGQELTFAFDFTGARNASTVHHNDLRNVPEGDRLFYHIMFDINRDKEKPIQLRMREANDALGPNNRPGVLQLIGEEIPPGYELALFKLCGEKESRHFQLPQWKPRNVTVRNLEQTTVQLKYRLVRANPANPEKILLSLSLEQNHPSNYDARLELDHVHADKEWQSYTARLSHGKNIEKFLAAMQENPNAGLEFVFAIYKQPFHTGDRIEIADIKFFHEENAPVGKPAQ